MRYYDLVIHTNPNFVTKKKGDLKQFGADKKMTAPKEKHINVRAERIVEVFQLY